MAGPGRGVEREIEEGVRRILGALDRIPSARIEEAAVKVSRAAERVAEQVERSTSRSLSRQERRLARRQREEEEASMAHAFVLAMAAAGAAFVGYTQPHLFWLLFVAFGFAMGAAGTYAKVRSRERRRVEEAEATRAGASTSAAVAPDVVATPVPRPPIVTPPPPAEPERPELASISARQRRVDGICDRLLAELKGAPSLVRELLRKPEETVEALRSASKELARRELELRKMLSEDEGERLRSERSELAGRAEAAPDAVVRSRLASALEALDAQLAHRSELSTAAARIEAEGTRILYSLESLRAQVLRAVAADAAADDVTRESLKGGLEALSGEIDAVATALEEVHGVGSAASAAGPSPGPTLAARAAALKAGAR